MAWTAFLLSFGAAILLYAVIHYADRAGHWLARRRHRREGP